MTILIDNTQFEAVSNSPNGQRAKALAEVWEGLPAAEILRRAITEEFVSRIALSSSFGADSAVLLHLIAQIDPAFPVMFLDTDRHFFQTLQYRDELVQKVGLTNLINLTADKAEAAAEDTKGNLWQTNPDQCCDLRKVRPLDRALKGYEAWISGRKRHQAKTRAALPVVEWDGVHFKVNPLVNWTADDIAAYFAEHDLPPHPLVEQGYPSIGCFTCTKPVEQGADARSGRWADAEKVECGIHRPIHSGDAVE